MMRDLATIFRREFAAYFNSAIGYIFIIVFIVLNCGLFVTAFFQFPMAEMRTFFATLPVMLCVFVPAITMRLWAEERKDNTLELLLTFPMNPVSIVMGKFLASLAFYSLALVGTLTIPLMIALLGRPDMGQILSSYLGAELMGAFFLAVGLFISGLVKDQIVAFVLSLMGCFGVFLLGTDFVAAAIDGWVEGLGSQLRDLVGATGHYQVFSKGVIEIADLLYFVVWTALFLFLNGMYMEGRGRRSAKAVFGAAVAICLGIGMAFNGLISGASLGRFDVTEGRIYTISEGTKRILSSLKVPVQIKYYVTPSSEMPTELKNLERDVLDKLEEMRISSGGKVQYKAIHMRAANVLGSKQTSKRSKAQVEGGEEASLETRMLEKGVEPFSVQARRQTGAVTKLVYSSIGVAYKEKKEEIIPRITPASLQDLEYSVVSTVFRLTRDKPAKVALVAPLERVDLPPELILQLRQAGRPIPPPRDPYDLLQRWLVHEKYDVARVSLTADDPLPDDFDVLVVIGPRGLNERQRWEIARAIAQGRPTLMAAQNYQWDYEVRQGKLYIRRRDLRPGVNELLGQYGVEIDERILMDTSNTEVRIARNQLEQLFGGGIGVSLPTHVLVGRGTMNPQDPLTARLSAFFYLWGSAIQLDQDRLSELNLKASVLATTTRNAWQIEPKETLLQSDIQPPPETRRRALPVLVRITGRFPDLYKDKPRPDWPEPPQTAGRPPGSKRREPSAGPVKQAPGELILLGCSQLFQKSLLRGGNLTLLLNSIDSLAFGPDLVSVRGSKPINRLITDLPASTATWWKLINYGLVSLILAGIGGTRTLLRRRSRIRYIQGIRKTPRGGPQVS